MNLFSHIEYSRRPRSNGLLFFRLDACLFSAYKRSPLFDALDVVLFGGYVTSALPIECF